MNSHIIQGAKCILMKTLHVIYGLCVGDTRYRSKLKQRLKYYFKDSIAEVVKNLKKVCAAARFKLATNFRGLQEDSQAPPKSVCIFQETLIK